MKRILLVSTSVSNSGHGKEYLTELYRNLKTHTDIFIPSDATINNNIINDNNIFKSKRAFSIITRENYIKYGKVGMLKRGFDRLLYGIKFHRELSDHIKNRNYDIVHILDSEYIAYAYLVQKLKKQNNLKIFYTIHASNFNLESFSISSVYKFIVKGFLKQSLKHTSGIICHGEWIKNRLLNTFPILKNKVYALNYPSNEYKDYDKQSIKRKLNLPLNKFVISFLGMIRKDKKIEMAIEIIKELKGNYHLLVAGTLADYKEKYINKLIENANIKNHITTDFKYLEPQEYEDYFKAGDFFLSTHSDTFPSASGPVSDARTFGLPVIVPPNGQLASYVSEYNVGVVSKGNDIISFVEACKGLCKEIDIYKENVVKTSIDLSWKAFTDQHLIVYNKVLND